MYLPIVFALRLRDVTARVILSLLIHARHARVCEKSDRDEDDVAAKVTAHYVSPELTKAPFDC